MNEEELRRAIADGDAEQRERLLREAIRTHGAALLSLSSIDDDGNLLELGLNSLSALDLTKKLMTITDMEIPLVTIVDYPTPAQLARHLTEEYDRAGEGVTQ
jgi:aryl carrier-like protein